MCHSSKDVEDEQHFLFSCPAYSELDKACQAFFIRPFLSQTFAVTLNQMHVVVFSESVFSVENLLYPPDISLSAFYVLYFVCWPPVGPQDTETLLLW